MLTGMLKLLPKMRQEREGGRLSTECPKKYIPNLRKVREEGREFTG